MFSGELEDVVIQFSKQLIAIGDVLQERDFLIAESNDLGIPLIVFSSPSCPTDDPADWAKKIREHFSIDIKDQYKCSSSRQFYLYLRERLENKGIFVQCFTDVPVEIVRGFSIYEQELPIIGINDNDRPPAKSFSLIHELVHLIKRESSVCNVMYNATSSQSEEVFCNAVAGELLVPKDALAIVLHNWLGSKQCVILPIDDEVQRNVKRIVTEHPKMISFSGGKGSSSGDAFLIATAMKYNLTIITEENKDKQNKIPNICKYYGIPTMSITELCVAEGWVF